MLIAAALCNVDLESRAIGSGDFLQPLPTDFAAVLLYPGYTPTQTGDDLAIVKSFYGTEFPTVVWGELNRMPEVAHLLVEALWPLRKWFGPDVQVQLRVVNDPENNFPPRLFADIQTVLPAEVAIARLAEFDAEWFLFRLPAAGDRFNFGLEYV